MGQNTNIQWTDMTWNIAVGCTKVDADCKYCYMYRDSLKGARYDPQLIKKTKTVFDLPLKHKEPKKIFTSSLTDVYHPGCDSFRHEMFEIIRKCPHHTFQILTKRPERIKEHTPPDILAMKNVWFGTSVGSQEGMHRLETLLDIEEIAVRFASFEPLHGPLEFRHIPWYKLLLLNWVIIGGESGNDNGLYKYRPCQVAWIKQIISDLLCIPVFVKQLGTHLAKELNMSDRHGSNINEFPIHITRREFPKIAE
jgi:protein gp37